MFSSNRFIRHNLTIFSVFDIFFILSVEDRSQHYFLSPRQSIYSPMLQNSSFGVVSTSSIVANEVVLIVSPTRRLEPGHFNNRLWRLTFIVTLAHNLAL